MARDRDTHINYEKVYEALIKKGYSTEQAARIANAETTGQSRRSIHKHGTYEEWTKAELYEKAKEVGIRDRSKMSKAELIQALRTY